MIDHIARRRGVVLAAITAGATLAGLSAALAGECPADKFKADVRAPVADAGKGVTDSAVRSGFESGTARNNGDRLFIGDRLNGI